MPRPASAQPTEVEMQILRILWELGPSPVREIHRRLEAATVGADGTSKDVGDLSLTPKFYRLSGRVILTDGKAVPQDSRLSLSRELGWDLLVTIPAADGSFSFAGVPEEAVTLNVRVAGYRLASRNRFQQVQNGAVAMFVDADKSGLEIFLAPNWFTRTGQRSVPICRNGPKGAAHKRGLSPFPAG